MTEIINEISIIIPVYNCKKYIRETLDSIATLDHNFNLELIIQNSNSNDGTTEIIDEYKKKFNNFVHINEKDQGQSDAINKGIARAKGGWVTWLGADDLLLPGFLELTKRLDGKKADVYYGDCVMLTNGKISPALGTEDFKPGKLARRRQYIQQPGTLIKKDIWDKVFGLNLKLNWTMDYDLFLRLDGIGARFVRVPDFVSAARIHHEAKTSSGSLKRLFEHYWVIGRAQIKKVKYISLISYAAYTVEYLIKTLEARGHSVGLLHKLFWKISKPADMQAINERFAAHKSKISKALIKLGVL